MPSLPPLAAERLADAVLILHVGVIAFVVLGTGVILIGGRRGWHWVRNLPMRITHLLLIAYVALQAWLDIPCPLTVWEQALRQRAGQVSYGGSFIEHWLSTLIFFDAPAWAFVLGYTAFALLVAACWRWVPPRSARRIHPQ